ncbi:MAG TPA: cytochrome c biogenesis protein CcdA, partial [Euzebya sp.]|nr:cytochrome c biogenesis protein CcdA [Euzebya sp.]
MASLAFAAGVLSFTSPCCLPLMPGYVAYISSAADGGNAVTDTDRRGTVALAVGGAFRTRTLSSALLFVTGFGIVFTALGAGASAISST